MFQGKQLNDYSKYLTSFDFKQRPTSNMIKLQTQAYYTSF